MQQGAPYNIYNAPVDKDAAMFFSDVNVIHGVVRNFTTDTPFGQFLTPGLADSADVEIIIRPQHLKMDFDRKGAGPLPTRRTGCRRGAGWRGPASSATSRSWSSPWTTTARCLKATIPGVFLPKPGTPLWLSLRRDRCFVFPCRSAERDRRPLFHRMSVAARGAFGV